MLARSCACYSCVDLWRWLAEEDLSKLWRMVVLWRTCVWRGIVAQQDQHGGLRKVKPILEARRHWGV